MFTHAEHAPTFLAHAQHALTVTQAEVTQTAAASNKQQQG